jgi:nucleoside-diphosphate-sugar epimerase
MKVFVAGASGALGRRLIPALLEAGHEVTGMIRSEESAERLRQAGAEAVVCDVFDRDRLIETVRDATPDAVVHQLTALPSKFDIRKIDYGPTNRLRTEGTRNLLDAAAAAGASRFVSQSIAFMYAPGAGQPATEDEPVHTDAPAPFGEAAAATEEGDRRVVGAEGMAGLVLRYGFFYGPGTYYAADGHAAGEVRKRRHPVVGPGSGVFPWIHIDDAASATVAAVERGEPGIYNVCDDEPAAMKDWVPIYAEALGAKKPFKVPLWLGRLAAGPLAAHFATDMRGASNAKAKRELGWQPRYPSWREGFRESLG